MCENVHCKVVDCALRHPRKCKFCLDYHYCKFGDYCKFLQQENEDKAIEAIENQLKDVKKELEEKEKAINELTENILQIEENNRNEIKMLWDKNEINEKDLQFLKAENENLKERLDVKESEFKALKKKLMNGFQKNLEEKKTLLELKKYWLKK